ncbi:MAG TPA: hypothetical protein PKI66_05610 [Methanobacteriaceae archaeon]|nr:hypothetical protein [Methanobacteriaceae archaeon]HNS25840.1 hypothetical protein [Methanobacteriaceae archaeon]
MFNKNLFASDLESAICRVCTFHLKPGHPIGETIQARVTSARMSLGDNLYLFVEYEGEKFLLKSRDFTTFKIPSQAGVEESL